MKTVGKFTMDETGTISGPADYMASEQFARRLRAIEAGTDMLSTCQYASSDPLVAALVSIQTDYAAWRGAQQIHAMGRR